MGRIPSPHVSLSVMNVNMLEHQRSLLAVMGIDIWIPQNTAQTRHYKPSLYRDQVEENHPIDVCFPEFAQAQSEQFFTKPASQAEQLNIEDSSLQLKSNPDGVQLPRESVKNDKQSQDEVAERQPLVIDAFEIQAMITKTHTILLDATALTTDQENLWVNIQRSVSSQFYDLKWPFNFAQFQDGRGAEVFIQGFIDALSVDKKILSLGCLPHISTTQHMQIASLQDMIKQPLLKRRLWNLIKN